MIIGTSVPCEVTVPSRSNERLRELLALHFHPCWGSRYWLRRQDKLGWKVCERIQDINDLWLLGPMPQEDLRTFPLSDFVPQSFHQQWPRFVTGETAGTSGGPCATAFRDDEFQAAFIDPFVQVAEAVNFPRGEPWLWLGPSGPHIIGKVVRELARQTGSCDPFSIDFDPRWAKRLVEGSLARRRYLDHLTDQALDVLRRESIGVLFTTPVVLAALTERLSPQQREEIHGIHYAGMQLTPEAVNEFRSAFPNAVHLAGYGNSLFGVLMELTDCHRLSIDYYPLHDRLQFQLVDWPMHEGSTSSWPPAVVERGYTGRVVVHRLDESMLIVGMVERDQAERIPPSAEALALGSSVDGLRNPAPAPTREAVRLGIY